MGSGGGGGGSSAAGRRGGGDLRAAREVREEEGERGRGGGGGMRKARVCVRAPHGAGALLVVGGMIVGAAVFAWCRHCRRDGGEGKGAKKHAKEEALDGGVVEDEQGDTQKLHQIYENLSRDNVEVGVNGSDGKATHELYQIQKDDEIVPSELVSEAVEKYDHNAVRDCAEITTDGMVAEAVEKSDHNSDRDFVEITAQGMGTESVTEDDDNSSKNGIENEIIVNDTKGAEDSDESTVSLSSPDIAHEEHDNHNCVAQDTMSTETVPITESATHQEQFSEDVKLAETAEVKLAEETETTPMAVTAQVKPAEETETTPKKAEVTPAEETETAPMAETADMEPAEETETIPMVETAEVKLAEEKVMKENEFEQNEEKAKEEPVELVSSLAYSSVPSLLKRTVKKRAVNPGWNETGMKLEQDCTNGELKEHELTKGGAILTMVRRTDSMAILALMFAVTIAITIVMRLYVPLQAT
ncbi:hypothetical protein E2562_022857 [Oryza meyeriana var. granulata]|uniref:Uncharacterized protein n=1 Tax=Oryza meyeriana var. granulata TaxID=110450 RepID=A0A6G1BNH8_9ORYZ|nr:hypothetical protein E2562_022857 [Oryza meyeriana var. granulata]